MKTTTSLWQEKDTCPSFSKNIIFKERQYVEICKVQFDLPEVSTKT